MTNYLWGQGKYGWQYQLQGTMCGRVLLLSCPLVDFLKPSGWPLGGQDAGLDRPLFRFNKGSHYAFGAFCWKGQFTYTVHRWTYVILVRWRSWVANMGLQSQPRPEIPCLTTATTTPPHPPKNNHIRIYFSVSMFRMDQCVTNRIRGFLLIEGLQSSTFKDLPSPFFLACEMELLQQTKQWQRSL